MLDSLVRVSKTENIQLNIYGYTDTLAGEAYNIVLSQKRADQVRNRLTNTGMNPAKILVCQGRGESGPGRYSGSSGYKSELCLSVYVEILKETLPETNAKSVNTEYGLNTCGIFGNPKIMKNLKVGDTLLFKFFGFERGGIRINYAFDNELKCFASAIRNRKALKFYYHGYSRDAEPDLDINGKPLKPGELCRIRYEAFLSYLAAYDVESSRFSYIESPDTGLIVRKPFDTDDWINIFEHSFLTVKEL